MSQHKETDCLPAGFILQVMLESSVYLALSVYCCCCLLAAIASCALPIETTGQALQESSHREWGQEMVGRASSQESGRIPQSSSGSQGWGHLFWGLTGSWTQQGKEARKAGVACARLIRFFVHHSGFKLRAIEHSVTFYCYSLKPPPLSLVKLHMGWLP